MSETWIVAAGLAAFAVLLSLGLASDGADAQADELVVVSLGDSYTAGNGAENYYGQSGCYRSYDSYPWRYVNRVEASGQASSIWHYACGGNVLSDIAGQVNQAAAAGKDTSADIVLVSIGGNDLGFSDVVRDCLIEVIDLARCPGQVDNALAGQDFAIVGTESVLRGMSNSFPNATEIVLVGYPDLNSPMCSTQFAPLIASLQNSYDLQQSLLVDRINADELRPDLKYTHVSLMDLYEGRGPCGTASIAGESPSRWIRKIGEGLYDEWVHPTKHGHDATAQLLFGLGIHVSAVDPNPTTTTTTTTSAPPSDADGDGVPDAQDQCPNTPVGIQVDSDGCPLDADADGVPDYLDQCPNTPGEAEVDANGCPLDSDGDGVDDYLDQCAGVGGLGADGCPLVHELLANEGFEVGSAWTEVNGGPTNSTFNSGGSHFEFEKSRRVDGEGSFSRVEQTVDVFATPGDSFIAQAMVMSIEGDADARLQVFANGGEVFTETIVASNDWQWIRLPITVAGPHTELTFRLIAPGGSNLRFDAASLQRSLVDQGGFEASGSWVEVSPNPANNTFNTGGAYEGALAKQVDGAGQFSRMQQSIPVENLATGDSLVGQVLVRGLGADGSDLVRLQATVTGPVETVSHTAEAIVGSDWQLLELPFSLEQIPTSINFQLIAPGGNIAVFDAVSLAHAQSVNGGFELNGFWTEVSPSEDNNTFNTGGAYRGDIAKRVDGNGMFSRVEQAVQVVALPGDTYYAQAVVKSLAGTGVGRLRVIASGGGAEPTTYEHTFTVGSDWTQLRLPINLVSARSSLAFQLIAPAGSNLVFDEAFLRSGPCMGLVCFPDPDLDFVPSSRDNCPTVSNPEQSDSNGDGIGDACNDPDPVLCNGLVVTVNLGSGEVPTAGDDVILGTENEDTINALAGDDVVCGLGGDDVINGGNGEDIIFGGEGDDRISGQGGVDTIFGEGGNDLINGGVGADVIHGGDGDDDLRGQGGPDTLNGDAGVDQFFGGSGNDVINTGEGGNAGTSQVVRGQSNNDTITGSSEADLLEGGPGLDIINGGDGGDTLKGGLGSDRLFGENGNDTLEGGATRDFLYGGDGDDTLKGGTGDDDLFGEAGSDTLDGQGDTDLCDGGADVDTATPTCETSIDIP